MPGILPASWANFFTRATNYEVDFSNFGRTLTTKGVGDYSVKQLADRAYIWGGIIVGGVGGYLLNWARDDESGNAATALAISLGIVIGFGYTHHQVTKQRVSFRTKMNQDIESLKGNILCNEKDTMPANILGDLIEEIGKLESIDENKAVRAMRSLYLRKTALQSLFDKLNDEEVSQDYWQQSASDILVDLGIVTESEDNNLKLN